MNPMRSTLHQRVQRVAPTVTTNLGSAIAVLDNHNGISLYLAPVSTKLTFTGSPSTPQEKAGDREAICPVQNSKQALIRPKQTPGTIEQR
jgi:hypothetical protein